MAQGKYLIWTKGTTCGSACEAETKEERSSVARMCHVIAASGRSKGQNKSTKVFFLRSFFRKKE